MTEEPNLDFELISISMLRDYLQLRGWERGSAHYVPIRSISISQVSEIPFFIRERKPLIKPERYSLRLRNGEQLEVAIPSTQGTPGSLRDLKDAISTIAEIEGKSPEQLLIEIHSVGFDIIRNRIPINSQDRGSIRLELAAGYIKKTKDLLSAAATTEMEPNSSFKRTLKEALAYSDSCRFGHTFRGSFGFTIESAVPPNSTPTLFPIEQPPPFERRVIRRLATGMELAQKAVREDDLAPLVESSESALGANGYELVAELVEETPKQDITFDFTFSPSWRERDIVSAPLSINLGVQHAEALRYAARQMRQPSIEVPARVIGLVTDLSLTNPSSLSDTRNKRRIVILWSSEQFGDIRVAANVSAQTYLKALGLHREERPIDIEGSLRRVGRNWNLIVQNEDVSGSEERAVADGQGTEAPDGDDVEF
jgi:hypothetical protein